MTAPPTYRHTGRIVRLSDGRWCVLHTWRSAAGGGLRTASRTFGAHHESRARKHLATLVAGFARIDGALSVKHIKEPEN